MSEKSSRIARRCNVIILIMEIIIFVWMMAIIDTDKDFFRQDGDKRITSLSAKNTLSRAKRSLRQSVFSIKRPGSSRTCQKLFDVWNASCAPSGGIPDIPSSSDKEEQSFVKDILKYFAAFRNNLKKLISAEENPEQANDDQLSRGIELNYYNTEITYAKLWKENLTSAEKCRREGLEGSLICEYEYDHPQQAAELYDLLRSLFTLETGLNGQAITANDEDSFLVRKASPFLIENEAEAHRKKRNIKNRVSHATRSKRSLSTNMEGEVCPTTLTTRSIGQACHARSGRMVSLYMFRGSNQTRILHAQQFELGFCGSKTPVGVRSNRATNISCRPAMIRVLATIFATAEEATSGGYRRCFTNIEPNFVVCRDFVLIPGLCKLFHNIPQ